MVSKLGSSMDTRGKSNAEFRNEVNEILACHESRFDQILTELQALHLQQKQPTHLQQNQPTTEKDTNPFAFVETSTAEIIPKPT